jgi:hypothetical protein
VYVSTQFCAPKFIAALFTIAKLWNQHRCPTTDEWIKTMWYIYTMEYYLAIKKNEILSFIEKRMELEIIMLHEISQAQKDKYFMFSLYVESRPKTKYDMIVKGRLFGGDNQCEGWKRRRWWGREVHYMHI